MTLYGVGLGPGAPDLVTVRGREAVEAADVVYSPGRLSRAVATEYVPDSRISDLDFPMTSDEDELRAAWKGAAAAVAPRARGSDAAFVTLGDPNVYSTFGHLRRTLETFHPDVDVEVVPGISAMTAFTTALGVEVEAGAGLALREAAAGAAPTGPDRVVLFKVTDAPETARKLDDAGYDVRFGRRLYMEAGETVVTDDPADVADRDYYTLAYAERRGLETSRATDEFDVDSADFGEDAASTDSAERRQRDGEQVACDGEQAACDGEQVADGGRVADTESAANTAGDIRRRDADTHSAERAEAAESGDAPQIAESGGDSA